MRRGRWQDTLSIELARHSRSGVVTARWLVTMGLSESTVYRRCHRDGPWQLLGPGIVLLSNGRPTPDQLAEAALLHGGPDAMLTGLEACRRFGLRRLPTQTDTHVLTPQTHQSHSIRHIRVERTWRLPSALVRDGFPVAPLARAVLDAARREKDPQTVAAMLAEPVQRRMVLPAALEAELEAGCRRGSAVPRQVLKAVGAGIRSGAEFDAREFWQRHELGPVEWNMRVIDLDGHEVAIVDALMRHIGFVWEVDSVTHHFATPEQVQRTARRRTILLESGLYAVSTQPVQTRDDEEAVAREIRAGQAIAARLPSPLLHYEPDIRRAA